VYGANGEECDWSFCFTRARSNYNCEPDFATTVNLARRHSASGRANGKAASHTTIARSLLLPTQCACSAGRRQRHLSARARTSASLDTAHSSPVVVCSVWAKHCGWPAALSCLCQCQVTCWLSFGRPATKGTRSLGAAFWAANWPPLAIRVAAARRLECLELADSWGACWPKKGQKTAKKTAKRQTKSSRKTDATRLISVSIILPLCLQ